MVHPRAIRRSHRQRMKRRAAKLYPAKCAGKLADNLAACIESGVTAIDAVAGVMPE